MTIPRNILLLCSAWFPAAMGLGCGADYSDDHCKDILQQIRAALQDNVDKGVLVRDAIPCGDDGVAHRADSFDPRVPDADVEYLRGAFDHACEEYLDHC